MLDDENASQHVTSVVVTSLGNQPEAFTSDVGDNRSRYLLNNNHSRVNCSLNNRLLSL